MANNITLSYPSAFYHQFLDRNGKPLTGGKLYTYSAGTPTPVPTYKTIGDTSSTNTNTNPIILDNAGMAYIVIETDKAYKFVLFDKNDSKIAEWDNVTGNIGGGGGSSEDIVVVGTPNEIDVSSSVTQGVKRYVISLSNSVKSTILYLVGLYTNVLNSLGNKADKVQGATAGNLAALDASGNLTDSGSKVADFKTKQTPVYDPSASGAGLEFIDSISQDENGEITPHKKSVQDGTTAQKGIVQLQDSIGSTESSTDKAVTPHAVREAINAAVSSAYHAAGTKSVAQLTSSLLVAENEGCVYNVTDSGTTTSDFVDGAGHPINAGDNVGVCDVGGGVYKFDLLSGFVDLTNYLTKTGDASNTTSTLTKASGDTSSMTSGSKLSAIFTAISSFFASVASALGGKADKVSNATNGDLAALDASGNLTDSGKKAADFDKKRYSWDTHGMYKVFESRNTDVSNKWVKLAEVDASSVTGNNNAIQFTGYVYNYGQNKRTYTKFVKVPFSAVFDITDDSQGVVVGNISGIDPLFGVPRVDNLIRIEKMGSKHWILELYTYSYQAYSLEIEASTLISSSLSLIVWATSNLTDAAPGIGTIINSTLDDCDNCVNSIKARDYASGGGIDLALGGKADKANITGATKCKITYNSQGIVTAGANLEASDIPNLAASKITSGTFGTDRIADDAITAAKVKDNETLPVNISGKSSKSDSLYTKYPSLTNFDDFVPAIDEVVQYSINGSYTNGPSGAASSGYWGVLQVFWRNSVPYQLFFNTNQMWVRYTTTQTSGSWTNWNAWTLVNSDASSITSGTFGTDRIADDAITAAKVKDNETLPVNISGTATHLSTYGQWDTWGVNSYDAANPFVIIGEQRWSLSSDNGEGSLLQFEFLNSTMVKIKLWVVTTGTSVVKTDAIVLESTNNLSFVEERIKITYFTFTSNNTQYIAVRLYVRFTDDGQYWRVRQLDCQTGNQGRENWKPFDFRSGSGTGSSSAVGTPFTYSFARPFASAQVGSTTTPVYVDSNGQVQPCTASSTLKTNTATLYIAGYTDSNIPYYHVKNIKNGCVNHVDFSGITNSTCDITFEAPSLSTGEEYDYVISLEGYTNNTGVSTGSTVENCKQVLHYDWNNNIWTGEPLFLQATDWRQICVVRGNTCEWKRVALS